MSTLERDEDPGIEGHAPRRTGHPFGSSRASSHAAPSFLSQR
jgi:hypothetical protein